jgi:small conductance mechanosensitive channel
MRSKAIKRKHLMNKILLFFPIRTLDFGIKGGLKLSQMELKINGATKEILSMFMKILPYESNL